MVAASTTQGARFVVTLRCAAYQGLLDRLAPQGQQVRQEIVFFLKGPGHAPPEQSDQNCNLDDFRIFADVLDCSMCSVFAWGRKHLVHNPIVDV